MPSPTTPPSSPPVVADFGNIYDSFTNYPEDAIDDDFVTTESGINTVTIDVADSNLWEAAEHYDIGITLRRDVDDAAPATNGRYRGYIPISAADNPYLEITMPSSARLTLTGAGA